MPLSVYHCLFNQNAVSLYTTDTSHVSCEGVGEAVYKRNLPFRKLSFGGFSLFVFGCCDHLFKALFTDLKTKLETFLSSSSCPLVLLTLILDIFLSPAASQAGVGG